MNTEYTTSPLKERNSTMFSDLKSLFKAPVLISNVLPVFTGFWLALHFTNSSFMDNLSLFILTILGSTILMAGALVLNNWYDVDIDTVMERTQKRPTVTGKINLRTVLFLGILLSIIGLVLLLFTTIEVAIYGFIGWFTYVILYTMWSKRKYTLNTVIGSISGAVSPLMGWAAITSGFHIVPIIFAAILFIWQMPHTFAIAMKKSEEYRAAKVAMLPVVYGFTVTKRQMAVYAACLLPLPLYLTALGPVFLVLATLVNLGFLGLCLYGFKVKDDLKWAHWIFLYSVNYLLVIYIGAILVTIPL